MNSDSSFDFEPWDKQFTVDREYLVACELNDLEAVKYWLDQGANVNHWTDENIETVNYDVFDFGLKYAAKNNYPEICDLLLAQANINVNQKDFADYYGNWYGYVGCTFKTNHTPLMIAVQHGHSEIVKRLVKAPGIDLNFQEPHSHETAAMMAVSKTRYWSRWDEDRSYWKDVAEVNLEIVKILSKTEGVDWNLENVENETPFTRALMLKDLSCLKLLRKIPSIDWNYIRNRGICPSHRNRRFRCSPLGWTLATDLDPPSRNSEAAQFLLSLPDVQVNMEEIRRHITEAVKECKIYVYEKILQSKISNKLYVAAKMRNFKMSLKEGKFKSIFYFLKFALEKDMSKNIVDVLVSVLKTWDTLCIFGGRIRTKNEKKRIFNKLRFF